MTEHELIQKAAYYIWQQRTGDGTAGDALSDWLRAEQQIRG